MKNKNKAQIKIKGVAPALTQEEREQIKHEIALKIYQTIILSQAEEGTTAPRDSGK